MGILRTYWNVNKALSRGATTAAATGAINAQVRRQSRGVRRGWLVPGDPPPVASAGGGYYDYRGVVDMKRVPKGYADATFPLGQFLSVSRGPIGPMALQDSVVERHVALVGPTGAGKTTSIIVPWMLSALRSGWSVVTIDVKGDLLARVVRENGGVPISAAGEFTYENPKEYAPGVPAEPSLRWNWLAELDSDRAIDNAVVSVLGKEAPKGVDQYFYDQDTMILRGLLELAAESPLAKRPNTSQLLRTLKDQSRLYDRVQRTKNQDTRMRLSNLVNDAPADYLKRINGVSTRLDPLARSSVAAVTSQSDFRVQDILDQPLLLSIVAPTQDGQLAHMFSSLLINQLLFRAYERFSGPQTRPLLLVIDEAADLVDRIDMARILSVARAAGVAVVFALQDVEQFKDDKQKSVLFANSGTVICTSQVSEETAKAVSKRIGTHPVAMTTTSVGPYQHGQSRGPSLSTSTVMAPVLGDREIMHPPFGDRVACVHSPDVHSAPFFVDLTRR